MAEKIWAAVVLEIKWKDSWSRTCGSLEEKRVQKLYAFLEQLFAEQDEENLAQCMELDEEGLENEST